MLYSSFDICMHDLDPVYDRERRDRTMIDERVHQRPRVCVPIFCSAGRWQREKKGKSVVSSPIDYSRRFGFISDHPGSSNDANVCSCWLRSFKIYAGSASALCHCCVKINLRFFKTVMMRMGKRLERDENILRFLLLFIFLHTRRGTST